MLGAPTSSSRLRSVLLGCLLVAALAGCGDDDGGGPGDGGGPPGDGGGPGGPDAGPGPGGSGGWLDPEGNPASAPDAPPLPASAFVFVRQPRAGVTHLYIHDTATGESRLLSALDDSTDDVRAALSPDRKLVAFTGLFRPSTADLATGVAQPSAWVVSVDGQRYRRVTDTVPIPDAGFPCTSNDVCFVVGMECNLTSQRCQYPSFRVTLGPPAWSADQQYLWLPFAQAWIGPMTGEPQGGSVLARVPVSGGPLELRDAPMGCRQASHSTTHPSRDAVTAIYSICGTGQAYAHIVELEPATGTERTLVDQMGVEPELMPPAWFPDGSGMLFAASASWDLDGDGSGETFGVGVAAYEAASGRLGLALPPLADGLSYASLSVAPDNTRIAICVRNTAAGTSGLVLLDTSNMTEPVRPLLDDGVSCYASW